LLPSSFHRHPGCQCPRAYFGEQCQFYGADARISDHSPGDKKNKGLVGALTILALLLAFGVIFVLYARKRHYPCSPFDTVIETAPAPTIDNLEGIDPWATDPFSDTGKVDVFEGEEYDEVVLDEENDKDIDEDQMDSAAEFDNTFSLASYNNDNNNIFNNSSSSDDSSSAASSLTMEHQDPPDEGPAGLMKTANLGPTSIASSTSDTLHVFNDSNDGSETSIV
jgi:hypothetical protein